MAKRAYSGRKRRTNGAPAAGRPHAAVAERFRFFLESTGLGREEFVAAVDGAITARSLFAVLAGTRQPSRALALLVERIFGFRAAFLLEGRGAMWTEPRDAKGTEPRDAARARLSPAEQALVEFSRASVENARALARALEQARLWERLFARTTRLLAELEACGGSNDAAERLLYPLFAKLVYEECQLVAARFEQLESLHHKRRVHALTTAFTQRFVKEVPRPHLDAAEARELDGMLAPVLERRRERARLLDAAIRGLRGTLSNLCELGSPKPLIEEHSHRRQLRAQRAALSALEQGIAALPRGDRGALRPALSRLHATLDAEPRFWPLFQQLVEGLLLEVEPEVMHLPAQSVAELEALHRRIVAPLRG